MSNTKISSMPIASALGGTEQLAGVQAGANVNITPAQIKTFTGGGTVTSVIAGAGLTGGTITATGTIALGGTLTNHGVLVGTGTAINATAAGTTGQVLTSGGASADPTYQTP